MIKWKENNCFSIGGVNFKAFDLMLGDNQSSLDCFIVQKPQWMINRYEQLLNQLKPKKIFELGIQRGGSCVMFQRLSSAEKMVSIDVRQQRIAALDQYIEQQGLVDSLKPLYGVDQSNKNLLRQIVSQEFAGSELDLVIDDASHFLDETRASFNILFPHLRPGGVYVIEDWSWAHGNIADFPDDTMAFYPDREPLTKLIFEIILACPSTHDYIEKIEIDKNSATVWRGKGQIDVDDFDIARCSLARGRNLISVS